MTDYEVIEFIKDEMLSDPEIEAGFAWEVYNSAQYDPEMYALMCEWMKDPSKPNRFKIEFEMQTLLDETGLINRRIWKHHMIHSRQ